MHMCCLPSWKAEMHKWGQNWRRQLVFPSLGQICGRALIPAVAILNHYNFQENAARVSSHKVLCLCQGSHGSPSSQPPLSRFLDEKELEGDIWYGHMKTTCASLSTPKTTSNAIHSRHCLTIWKHPVLKKKALWLAWKLLSWFLAARWVVQDELCQASTAFQKASKFRTAWIVFKLSSTTELLLSVRVAGMSQAEWAAVVGTSNPLRMYTADKQLGEVLQSPPRVKSTSEDLGHNMCSPFVPEISSVAGAVAPLSTQPALAR